MNQDYVDTVRLLLDIAPAVFAPPRFAMKGGTALNLFVHDMPRLSIDIDVVFTDHTLDRENALDAIGRDLQSVKTVITSQGHRATLPTSKNGDEVKLLVSSRNSQVKVEVNFVFRGTLLPVERTPLVIAAQELFTTEVALPVLATAELYGSKLVAAMDRQHPRDLFDVMRMLERFGWQSSIVDCFVAYLAGHNRPVHEVLFPVSAPLEPTYSREFAGMTRQPIEHSSLENVQKRMIEELPRALTKSHRQFLLSLVAAEPEWSLLPFKHLPQLPALQWKLLNLRQLRSRSASRFESQYTELEKHLKRSAA